MSRGPDSAAALFRDARLRSCAPLLYVAWADGQLQAPELEHLRGCLPPMEEGRRAALEGWLDPEDPPSAEELADLLAEIRRAAGDLPRERARSLAELGVELAGASGEEATDDELETTRRALLEVEAALGVVGEEAARVLLPEPEEPGPPESSSAEMAGALRGLLDGGRGAIRDRVREILRRPEMQRRLEIGREEYRERVLEQCRILADEGIGGLALPREAGGGGDLGDFIAAFETLALGDASVVVKLGVQFGLFGGSIHLLGTERHHRKYLAEVVRIELPGCFAMSETGHGSNVRDLETLARYDPEDDTLVVHTPSPSARKDWIGNAARHGRMATVFAQLEVGGRNHGVHAILVPIRGEDGEPLDGIAIEDCGLKLGLNGVDNGRIAFDHVRVPRENLLDRYGSIDAEGRYSSPIPGDSKRFFTMLGTLVGGRVSVAAAAVSAGKVGLAIAVRYGARRRQFGPAGRAEVPILDYRTHQLRLLPRVAGAYASSFAQHHLVERFLARTEETTREVEALAAGLKSYASWWNVETLQTCRECCGGQGYLAVNRIGLVRDDTDVYTTFEGDNVVLMQLVARSLLTDFRQQFEESRFFNLLKLLGTQAARAIAELNPIVTHRTDVDHLRTTDFQLGVLRYREQRVLIHVARRLRSRIAAGMDSFDATIEVQDHLLVLANAHVERVIAESFAAVIEEVEDPEVRRLLDTLRDLWVLSRIHADRGWFLAHEILASSKSKAIRDLVPVLCGELRPHAVTLVDAFGIPDELLAPIAVD